MPPKLSQDQFLAKVTKIHNGWYNYSKTDYKGNKIKVTIICPDHGQFEQRAGAHASGKGCPACRSIKSGNTRANTTEQFIALAKKVHGDKYQYDMVAYINRRTPVIIICPDHGGFLITPEEHLHRKMTCCNTVNRRAKSKDEYIQKFIQRHGDRYDYSAMNFVNGTTPVTIICKKHGAFEVSPYNHCRKGFGCKACSLLNKR